MGFFDSFARSFTSIGKKIAKPFVRTAKVFAKGGKQIGKTLKKQVFNDRFASGFRKGFGEVGKALQVPAKFIAKNDPLGKVMGPVGFLSPIQLGTGLITQPLASIGYLEQLAVDKKLQKKLRSGDMNTIIDTALAPVGLVPLGFGGSSVAKGIGKGAAKSAAKNIGRATAKRITKVGGRKIGKKITKVATKKITKGAAKSVSKGATKSVAKNTTKTGKFNEQLLAGLKPIKEIPKQPFIKQTLTKAQRLKNAKAGLAKAGRTGKSVKALF